MRQILPLWLSFFIVSLIGAAHAQEPSAALRQAGADYREGVAALNRNDLETARTRFVHVPQNRAASSSARARGAGRKKARAKRMVMYEHSGVFVKVSLVRAIVADLAILIKTIS
jgi:hypothetical protein